MAENKQLKLQHFLWRSGFGPASWNWEKWEKMPERQWWPSALRDSGERPVALEVASSAFNGLSMGLGQLGKIEGRRLSDEQRKQLRQQSREDLKSLNLRWLEEMVNHKAQLREKMAFFWHGHFASRNLNILYQQQMLDVIRQTALGNFGTMLRAVSKSAAMLAFLNNQQNKKLHPNENFAREVMELFTLGRGHYSEQDVKEAARAFTGWGFRLNGEFVFRQRDHDAGTKTVLGKKGHFTGDDVLDILLEQKQTAVFITRKIYRFLVNEDRVPEERIAALATRFYDSNYDIPTLLEAIFTSNWFYDPENIGCKIKSPIELWTGIRRQLWLQIGNPEGQLAIQKALGQVLFYPPNVAGWPGGRSWIDSSSLMLRLRIPQMLLDRDDFDVRTRDDDDVAMGIMEEEALRNGRRQLNAEISWNDLIRRFKDLPDREIAPTIARALWQTPEANPPKAVMERFTVQKNKLDEIKSTVIQLMATPEYQVC